MVTLKGRAYYRILQILKAMNIEFISSTIDNLKNIPLGSSLIITTKEERDSIMHNNVLFDTDLEEDLIIAKVKIYQSISNCTNNTLLIGIDPGKRIGLSILYNYEEIDSRIVSFNTLIELIEMLIDKVDAKTIIKIGNGDLRLALKIAYTINHRFVSPYIELVDEYGTSTDNTKRGVRDRLAARAIAYRRGKNFKEYIGSYVHYKDHYQV